ncbi:hypothetical protein K439DRAFT_581777 [Ramaria rubella]|nr:hypothetical protein K439DRAFT_581777 [Ramaria rubella]
MTSTPAKDKQLLPLADILRDLALLRASDLDLTRIPSEGEGAEKPEDQSVQRSYEFVKEARAALRIQSRSELDSVGEKLDHVRESLEKVLKGLGES